MAAVPELASLIDGTPVPGSSSIELTSPSDRSEVVSRLSLGDADTIVTASERAMIGQREWARVPAPIRGVAIGDLGRILTENKPALARIVTREMGKPFREALGEVQEAIDTCIFFASEGRRLYGMTVPSEMPDKQLFTFRKPVGAMAVVTAGNFPIAVPSWYLIPALLAGNAVVWKPAEYAPAVADAFVRCILAAGIPPGVVQLALTDGPAAGAGIERALAQGRLQKVGFTGSSKVGADIAAMCGRHLVAPTLELGGKNPLVVTADADIDLAVEGALFSAFGTAGQRCTSLGIAIVHESVHAEFMARFTAATEAAPIGDPMQDVLYGPMISDRFSANFEAWLEEIRPHHRVTGSSATGRISSSSPRAGFVGDPDAGIYQHPVIVDGVTPEDRIYQEETFGPIAPVTTFADLDEAVVLANGHGYGLSAAIYTTNPRDAFRFREGVSAGMLSVNNSTSGAEAHLPFGGNGRSGSGGRLSGVWVLDQMTTWQSMNWDFSGKLQKAQMDVVEIQADLGFRI